MPVLQRKSIFGSFLCLIKQRIKSFSRPPSTFYRTTKYNDDKQKRNLPNSMIESLVHMLSLEENQEMGQTLLFGLYFEQLLCIYLLAYYISFVNILIPKRMLYVILSSKVCPRWNRSGFETTGTGLRSALVPDWPVTGSG
jgi:hypothetical protein